MDNPRPHRVRLVDENFNTEDIQVMESRSRSLDLNPMKSVYDALGRAIEVRQSPPKTIPKPKNVLTMTSLSNYSNENWNSGSVSLPYCS
ncbi:hypothetical protein TNCV_3185811 [Trichonephila clavipes]|nr:hypothetical protein TNCV_3185811 [Trichonephila clavipes]